MDPNETALAELYPKASISKSCRVYSTNYIDATSTFLHNNMSISRMNTQCSPILLALQLGRQPDSQTKFLIYSKPSLVHLTPLQMQETCTRLKRLEIVMSVSLSCFSCCPLDKSWKRYKFTHLSGTIVFLC